MLRKQPKVQRVNDRAHARNCEVQLQVPVVVERQGGHSVPGLDAKPLQHSGEAVDARHHLPVSGSMHPFVSLGDDFLVLVQSLNPPQHVLQAELIVLHQALHGQHLPLSLWTGRVQEGRW